MFKIISDFFSRIGERMNSLEIKAVNDMMGWDWSMSNIN